jgi:hypothetical protein
VPAEHPKGTLLQTDRADRITQPPLRKGKSEKGLTRLLDLEDRCEALASLLSVTCAERLVRRNLHGRHILSGLLLRHESSLCRF